jgi:hypothetical protein
MIADFSLSSFPPLFSTFILSLAHLSWLIRMEWIALAIKSLMERVGSAVTPLNRVRMASRSEHLIS